MTPLSAKSRKTVFLIIAIAVVMRLALAFRPEPKLASRPYSEDAFYAFSAAYHLSLGHGLTADGIHQTNGIQPLIVFLYVPFFEMAGEDKWLALRLIFILIAILEAATIWLMALLMRRLSCVDEDEVPWWQRPWIMAPAMIAFLYPIYWHHANGLETGLYAMLIIASLHYYAGLRLSEKPIPASKWAILGGILGITVLARIDAVFLVGGIGLTELTRQKQKAIAPMLIVGLVAFVISSPWWFYNYLEFGNFMPISGQSQQILDVLGENVIRSFAVLADIVSTFFYLPYYYLPSILLPIWVAFVGMLIYQLSARIKVWKLLPERSHIQVLTSLAIASVCLVIYYIFFFGAPHFLPRYYHPIRLLWVMLLALSLPIFGPSIVASYKERKGLFYTVAIPIAVLAIGFNVNRYYTNFGSFHISELYGVGKWAEVRPDKKIGMYQSGTANFVSPNVINLDGKVNPDALRARAAGSIGSYIKEQNLDYLADWPEYVGELAVHAERYGMKYKPYDSVLPMIIYERVDSVATP